MATGGREYDWRQSREEQTRFKIETKSWTVLQGVIEMQLSGNCEGLSGHLGVIARDKWSRWRRQVISM